MVRQRSHPQASRAGGKQKTTTPIPGASYGTYVFLASTSLLLRRGARRCQQRCEEEAEALPAGREGTQDPPPKPPRPPLRSLPRTPSPRRAGQAPGREQKRTAPLVWHPTCGSGTNRELASPALLALAPRQTLLLLLTARGCSTCHHGARDPGKPPASHPRGDGAGMWWEKEHEA